MALENLTARERLALDLEHCTVALWVLVNRNAGNVDKPDEPTRVEIEDLVEVLRRLDALGAGLGPHLYRAAEKRCGRLNP
jgi:hypothetical protein